MLYLRSVSSLLTVLLTLVACGSDGALITSDDPSSALSQGLQSDETETSFIVVLRGDVVPPALRRAPRHGENRNRLEKIERIRAAKAATSLDVEALAVRSLFVRSLKNPNPEPRVTCTPPIGSQATRLLVNGSRFPTRSDG